ncbi:hypothetical protein D3C87_351490 [compost metagenome]
MTIGVCLFDDLSQAKGGWSSVNGSQATRISSMSELRSDIFWVTNLDYVSHRKLNLNKTPNIFDAQYFRSSLKLIASENGLLTNPTGLVEFASAVFSRIVDIGNKEMGISLDEPSYRYFTTVASAITPAFMRKRPECDNQLDLMNGIKQSTQANQAMSGQKVAKGSSIKDFSFPRGAYARWLLSLPYPGASPWEEIKKAGSETILGVEDGVQIRGTISVLEKLKEWGKDHAVLLRVAVLGMDPFFKPFASFGVGVKYPRRWATLPEILNMSRYCKISLSGGYRTRLAKLDLLGDIDLESNEYSYSRGLFLENLWVSLANPMHSNEVYTAVGAYMRAYDRIACQRVAETFAEHQFRIGSFGSGRVMVYVSKPEEQIAGELALSAGMNPPFEMIRGGNNGY